MRGTRFDPPTIKFEGSTDDSMMDIHPQIGYEGMNEFIQVLITCAHNHYSNLLLWEVHYISRVL